MLRTTKVGLRCMLLLHAVTWILPSEWINTAYNLHYACLLLEIYGYLRSRMTAVILFTG